MQSVYAIDLCYNALYTHDVHVCVPRGGVKIRYFVATGVQSSSH